MKGLFMRGNQSISTLLMGGFKAPLWIAAATHTQDVTTPMDARIHVLYFALPDLAPSQRRVWAAEMLH